MTDILHIGDMLPKFMINLAEGGQAELPKNTDAEYNVLLFYRGHWWPYCRRQLTAFAEMKSEFDELGINIYAASADPMDKAQEVANELNFPVGKILASSYSCGPVGRMDAADVVKLVKYFEAKKRGSNWDGRRK
jgi:peroxiredoxin